MIILNKNTKKAQNFITNYENAKYTELNQIYKNYSTRKYNVFNQIKEAVKQRKGKGLKLISWNCQLFCCGYMIKKNKKNVLVYLTGFNQYLIEL